MFGIRPLCAAFAMCASLYAGHTLVLSPPATGKDALAQPAVSMMQSAEPAVGITALLADAATHQTNLRYREAELLLSRAVNVAPEDMRTWRALSALYRAMTEDAIQKQKLPEATQSADRAQQVVARIAALCTAPEAPLWDPRVVTEEEKATEATRKKLCAAVDQVCRGHIAAANQLAEDAYHSGWNVFALGFRTIKNDRNKVVDGLKRLAAVKQFEPWISEDVRLSVVEAYCALNKLVYAEEWDELLARAGFDPGSAETFKR